MATVSHSGERIGALVFHDASCVFCRIVRGEIPSKTIYEDDFVLAFRDIEPVAPTHVLLIPKQHIGSFHALAGADVETFAALAHAARHIAESEGVAESGYRVVTNIGSDGGQSVDHLHFHVLGGRALGALG